ncbi:MAG: bifunctional 4-hydroxy-3-methylbut-2-enyl diphosphate reductase/30S ribosomal protein S1 [Defluviitaleaceae bacterium]|nr:bifunctional 4-hydroxy-3-methylbut-2-enyl diphosphate reductase/30S ribosomal protein S1 [Defluviitaleaceae bacterium]
MEIIIAKSSGFCYGVARAIKGIYKEPCSKSLVCLGPVTHNKIVLRDLSEKGISVIDKPSEALGRTVVIRAHGVGRNVYEFMEEEGIAYKDFTCPDVTKIHNIIAKQSEAGYEIIIVGDSNHPEIIGSAGWCGNIKEPVIINSYEEAAALELDKDKKYSVVAQTTFRTAEFESIANIIKSKACIVEIYNTICPATEKRQQEAYEISTRVDKMIVLGDKLSANTRKLYEICKKNCENTYFIESIEELELNNFQTNDKIGITAGASTPPEIIKEAVTRMSEHDNKANDQSFEEMLDESFVTLHTGDVVKGTVIQIINGEVSVNLGYKSDGLIPRSEFSDDPNVTPETVVSIGDEIEVFVVRVNDGEGNVLLSKKRLEIQKGYTDIEEAFNNKTTVSGRVTDLVKGGLIVMVKGVRVFVPSSQISPRYVEGLQQFKGKEFDFNILEYDRSKRRVVGGRKDLAIKEEAEKKEKIFSSIEEGQRMEGVVSRIADFGAFVDIGGVDGLIHISELSWGRVKKVGDVLKAGDNVTVTVLKVDREKDKISLSLKDIGSNPWNSVQQKYPVGAIVDGIVVRMVPFGAFVELEPGVDGLVHISQIAAKHVAKAEDELKIGQPVSVKVVDIDLENKKISLSKKEADGILYPQEVEAEEEVEEAVEEKAAEEPEEV